VTHSAEVLAGAERALTGLKDFQRETVDHVFERLYGAGFTRKFLVADEVGLGKTLIARGVVARAIQHLQHTVPRIDIVYICSNGDIARQNINRLTVGGEHRASASRLTLLPKLTNQFRGKPGVNFVSFTPGTSFDVHDGFGQAEERILLYAMLREIWDLGSGFAPLNVLQGQAGAERFRAQAKYYVDEEYDKIDPQRHSTRDFATVLRAHPDLRSQFNELCEHYPTTRSSPADPVPRRRRQLVGQLRALLASSCIHALEPDLIILDEFQRFTHLLDGEEESSQLARELFNFGNARVLMLSATPYKMYTTADEADAEDHYRDFVRTIQFLEGPKDESIDVLLKAYRAALFSLGDANTDQRLVAARTELEARLRRVIVRTERLASTPDRNGMLKLVTEGSPKLTHSDVLDYVALGNVSRLLEEPSVLEYWKSASYVLNFMDRDYKLKRSLNAALENGETRQQVARALATSPSTCLSWEQVERYGEVEPANGRLRSLLEGINAVDAHRLLWIPPTLPYYQLGGVYADPRSRNFTKRLVFSAWRMVPRVIASLVSYEVERRMMGGESAGANTPEARKRRAALLTFTHDSGRLGGMPVLALLYPSSYLARACDPLKLGLEHVRDAGGALADATLAETLACAETQIDIGLRRLPAGAADGPVDERWYWAAPLMLDQALEPDATKRWFERDGLADIWSGAAPSDRDDDVHEGVADEGASGAWTEHVALARSFAMGQADPLGRRPADLAAVLAQIALGAPGVTMLRAMLRVVGMSTGSLSEKAGVRVRDGAAEAAWSFRSLFNQPEVMALLRADSDSEAKEPYWRKVLAYCVDGCLQSVLDEYTHLLRDHLGLVSGEERERVHEIAGGIRDALSLRASSLGADELSLSDAGRTVKSRPKRMRCHFALRFGDETDDSGAIVTRKDSVRKAFNSPFWPFVVATTSVGQEGLDFHGYCHAVFHWNLPSSPVDLEQREGRVHRYKGHAVRKNVALAHSDATNGMHAGDPWELMFGAARAARAPSATDIVPYWVYPVESGARIERHVPTFPLSREHRRRHELLSSLAIYRMAFGQPRQDDLLRYLETRIAVDERERIAGRALIDLSPPRRGADVGSAE
jgi:hypothetical protein